MDIKELDEAQGVTPKMVRAYLLSKGWTQKSPRGTLTSPNRCCVIGKPSVYDVSYLSMAERRSPVSILNEINPRWRGPGYPSNEAVKAHGEGGWWLFKDFAGNLHTATGKSRGWGGPDFYWENSLMGEPGDAHCFWWPCDQNANRVRWPERDGVML
mgnify:CR=1 FL=1